VSLELWNDKDKINILKEQLFAMKKEFQHERNLKKIEIKKFKKMISKQVKHDDRVLEIKYHKLDNDIARHNTNVEEFKLKYGDMTMDGRIENLINNNTLKDEEIIMIKNEKQLLDNVVVNSMQFLKKLCRRFRVGNIQPGEVVDRFRGMEYLYVDMYLYICIYM
jgi:hypothetical protein